MQPTISLIIILLNIKFLKLTISLLRILKLLLSGEWLRQKTHNWEVVGSNLHYGDYFSCTIHLNQSMEAKIEWKLTWHCCICCNPAKGRVAFEDGWLIISSFIRMKWKLVSWPGPNPTKKEKKSYCCEGAFVLPKQWPPAPN